MNIKSKSLVFIFLISLFPLPVGTAPLAASQPAFKFVLKHEPQLDPALMTPGESTYLFHNMFRGLTRFADVDEVVYDQAKRCRPETDTLMTCTLRDEAKWSDGTPVTASDFVWSFRHLLNPKSHCPVLNLVFNIKNARAVYAGKMPATALGVKALSDKKLQFELEERDTSFLDKLSNPLLAAYKEPLKKGDRTSYVVNGPYKVKLWEKNKKIVLEPNTGYYGGAENRPPVEIYFAAEDAAALDLYEKGQINFLWRLTSVNIPKFKDRPDFVQIPQSRLDYVGFNLRSGSPFEKKEIRQAFAASLNFDDFKKAFYALGAPGCPGLLEPILDSENHCNAYNPKQPPLNLSRPVKFMYSQLGGDDIRRQAEWFQEQWHEHLGVKVELKSMEQKHFRQILRTNPPPLFRVGVRLEYPTCMAGMERFLKGNPENYTGFYNERFEKLAYALTHHPYSRAEQQNICGVMSDILFKQEVVGVPLGKIHFSLLADPQFKGWVLNDLNQLDLSQLQYTGKK